MNWKAKGQAREIEQGRKVDLRWIRGNKLNLCFRNCEKYLLWVEWSLEYEVNSAFGCLCLDLGGNFSGRKPNAGEVWIFFFLTSKSSALGFFSQHWCMRWLRLIAWLHHTTVLQHDGQCTFCVLYSCIPASHFSRKKCNPTPIACCFSFGPVGNRIAAAAAVDQSFFNYLA